MEAGLVPAGPAGLFTRPAGRGRLIAIMRPGHVEAGGVDTASELLERSELLGVLERSMSAMSEAREGRLVLLRGEAGVGKTAVVRAFCEQQQRSRRVLWGACEALFTPRALGPFVDIAEAAGGELGALLERGARPHEVLSALAGEVARRSPTVLAIEDLHWADAATLDVLRLLGRRIAGVRALVIATYRDDEVDRSPQLRVVLGELARAPGVDAVDVPRLSRRAVATLAEPSGADPEELYRRTAGNAFFVTEALAAETETIPPTVRDAVLARAASLSESATSLLEAVAVAQSPDLEVIEAMADSGLEGLEECIGCGMLAPVGRGVAFRHELARLVIEEAIPPNRRGMLHERALRALVGTSDYARLAHHAEAAGDPEAVLRFAPQAARQASVLGAHRESAAHYARVLRFAEGLSSTERAELLEHRAYECMLADLTGEAVQAARDAVALRNSLGDVRAQSGALQLLSHVLWCPGYVAESTAAARQAFELVEGLEPGRELALAQSRLAQLAKDAEELDPAVESGTGALRLAKVLDDTELYVHSLTSVASARFLAGEESGREELERARALALEAGLEEQVGRANINLVWCALRHRDYDLARGYLEPALRYASDHGAELWRGYLLAYRARMELNLGRWEEAVDTAEIILREPRRSRIPQIEALAVIGRLRARRGDPDIWTPLDEALSLAERSEELHAAEPVAMARAEAAWLEGDVEGVERATAATLELARSRRSPWVVAELASWRKRAGITDRLDDNEAAGPYVLELADDWSGAAAAWRKLGLHYEAALSLADSGDPEDLRGALDELQDLGAHRAHAIVARRLREQGVRGVPRGPRARTRENPARLTARELDVLELLVEGLRNAQIAERLVVSERTVDHHVSAILRKLDVGTRGEAAAEANRRKLLAPS
jgi:DNA-binding CsgD family transcriptional regulator/tetratricopeptide (TPR) repeat protein